MKILLLSDNHGNLNTVKRILQENKHDIAIHLGDGEIPLDFIRDNFDYYICGNHENWTPLEQSFVIQNLQFFICHGHTRMIELLYEKFMSKFLAKNKIDFFLHGHTHVFKNQKIGNSYVLNPGSTSFSRGPEGNGFGILTINDGKFISFEFKSC